MLQFNEETHTYSIKNKPLISVTTLLKKHGLAPDYSSVDEEKLKIASDKGVYIHKEIEDFIRHGELGFTTEFDNFLNIYEKHFMKNAIESEKRVHNSWLAGTIDLVGLNNDGDLILVDIKTTYSLNKEYIAWQLSLYNYLLSYTANKLYVLHLRDETAKLIEIEPINKAEINNLIQCEEDGVIYTKPKLELNVINHSLLINLQKIEQAKIKLEKIVEKEKEIKAMLLQQMEEHQIKSHETEYLKISYVGETIRETIDTTKLKKDYPDIAQNYLKVTKVKPNLRITLRTLRA